MKPELKKLVEQLEKIKSIDELQAWKKDHELSKDLLKGALARSQDLLTISPKEALQLSEWALSVAFDLEDPWLEASALRAKGNALLFVDDYFLGLEYFEGALKPYPHSLSVENLEALARVRGCSVGRRLAEAFCLVRDLNP